MRGGCVDTGTLLIDAFKAGVESVRPDRLIRDCVRFSGDSLTVCGSVFPIREKGRLWVVGAGKASALMAQECERKLGDRISGGAVVVKYGHAVSCRRVDILQAGHPYPDLAGVEATRRIVRLCQEAGEDDLVLFLLSGGGSALLADYPEESSLAEVTALSKLLVNSGADIREINAVRKHLSGVKGGQLARLAYPARVVSLILSDVVGDPLDVIASGPTVADASTFADAVEVCRRYGIAPHAPPALMRRLSNGVTGLLPETPKDGDPGLSRTVNFLIGANRKALEASLAFLHTRGVAGEIVTDRLVGGTEAAAEQIVTMAVGRSARERAGSGPYALLFGGETTLTVTGAGLGGRNQHLALKAAQLLNGRHGVTLLAAGTDGTDGPTDMAGGVVDGETWTRAQSQGVDAADKLRSFDSYSFFLSVGGHVYTGPTLTNVMDLVFVLVQ